MEFWQEAQKATRSNQHDAEDAEYGCRHTLGLLIANDLLIKESWLQTADTYSGKS
jgi:hypothetical protein